VDRRGSVHPGTVARSRGRGVACGAGELCRWRAVLAMTAPEAMSERMFELWERYTARRRQNRDTFERMFELVAATGYRAG